jgi:hypothetical protein
MAWTRVLPAKSGLYWSAFRWPSDLTVYPYVVQMVTVFGVNHGGSADILYVRDLLPAHPLPLADIATYAYDVWWIEVVVPEVPA